MKGQLLRPKSGSQKDIGVLKQMKTFLGHRAEFQRENLRAWSKTAWMYDGLMKLHPCTTACTPWSLRTPRQAWWNEHDEGGKCQAPEQEEATQHFIVVSPAQSSLEPVPPPRWAWSVRCQKDRPSKRDYCYLYLITQCRKQQLWLALQTHLMKTVRILCVGVRLNCELGVHFNSLLRQSYLESWSMVICKI